MNYHAHQNSEYLYWTGNSFMWLKSDEIVLCTIYFFFSCLCLRNSFAFAFIDQFKNKCRTNIQMFFYWLSLSLSFSLCKTNTKSSNWRKKSTLFECCLHINSIFYVQCFDYVRIFRCVCSSRIHDISIYHLN